MSWELLQERIAGTVLARRSVDMAFRSRARRRIAELDHISMARCQQRILLGLVHRAQGTRFGRDHDFQRIRTPADFRRLVPLRTLNDHWKEYWQTPGHSAGGVTWPTLAVTSNTGPSNGAVHDVPVTADLLAAHRNAALTALAFVCSARPAARLFSGRLACIFIENGLSVVDRSANCSIEVSACRQLPPLLRPYAVALPQQDFGRAEVRQGFKKHTAAPVVTCVLGAAGLLADLFTKLKEESDCARLTDLWPGLTSAIYTCCPNDRERSRLQESVAGCRDPLLLETCYSPAGAIAVEDPRRGCLRLLADHGVFFEFIPRAELGQTEPTRHSLAEIETEVPYSVAISSPAGAWACLVGEHVVFESLDPPLLRRLAPVPIAPQIANAAHPFAVQPPHYRRDLAGKSKPAVHKLEPLLSTSRHR